MCFKEGNSSLPMPTSARFSGLLYMRCNYTFVYVSAAGSTGVALDSVEALMSEGLGWPTQGHIALTSNEDEMMVSYVTGTTTTPSVKFVIEFLHIRMQCRLSLVVRYGLRPDALGTVVFGNTTTYTASEMCDQPANVTGQV